MSQLRQIEKGLFVVNHKDKTRYLEFRVAMVPDDMKTLAFFSLGSFQILHIVLQLLQTQIKMIQIKLKSPLVWKKMHLGKYLAIKRD